MIVRHNIIKWNVMSLHQIRCQLGGTIKCAVVIIATMLAHLDPDACAIAHAIYISMFALLVGRQMLDGHILLHRIMPDQVANAIATTQGTLLQGSSMIIGIASVILCAVNGDVTRTHRHVLPVSVTALRNDVFVQVHLS